MNDESQWRRRYGEAVRQLDAEAAHWRQRDGLLRRLAGRLCLAAAGRHAILDAELDRIASTVRTDAPTDELERLLEPLSRAVARLDEPSAAVTVAAERPAGAAAAPEPDPPLASAGTPPVAAPATAEQPEQSEQLRRAGEPELPRIGAALAGILERLELPPELQSAALGVRERLAATDSLAGLTDSAERIARLAGEQRLWVRREKLDAARVLRQVTSGLDEVAKHFVGEMEQRAAAEGDSQTLNALLGEETDALGNTVRLASDLGELQRQVRVRLQAIEQHVRDFRAREEIRARTYRERTGRMRARIEALERESRSLIESLQAEQRLALLDALTGIPNRAAYDERIAGEHERWRGSGAPLCVLAWDIDRFKQVNDAYGHRAGDKVIRVIAQHLAQHARSVDFVARYGGEEFVMILPGTDLESGRAVAERIREEIAQIGFHFRGQPVMVTASCGIAGMRPDDTPDSVFDRADRALYRAKEAGRNRVTVD